jgi:D-alanyl-D-alanine carboxypeptidase
MEQAMYAMLLASANEAAYAVGETVAAEQGQDSGCEWFVEQMNAVCEELGGMNSNFVNTNGVFEEDHYTCARDMALIGRALFDYPLFFQICQTQQYVIEESDTVEEHTFQQKHHMLLKDDSEYYEYVIGGKTGYTTEAENTLITMADNGERKLVCVVLKTYSGHPYSDTRALLEYGFDNFEKVSIAEQETEEAFTWIDEDAYVLLPKKVSFDQLDREVEASGDGRNGATVTYYYKGNPVGSCQVTLSDDYQGEGVTKWNSVAEQPEEEDAQEVDYRLLLALGAVALLLISAVIAGIVTGISRKRKRRRRRR